MSTDRVDLISDSSTLLCLYPKRPIDLFLLSRNLIAALTGAEGRASKRSLLVRPSVSGQAPCSGAPGATGQGAGRSQRRDSRRRQSPGTPRVTCGGFLPSSSPAGCVMLFI